VTARPDVHQHNPVWSPDGQWLYFVRGPSSGASFEMDIWRVRPSGESLEQLTHLNRALNYLAPVGTRTVLFTARDADQSGPWLWTLDVPTRQVQRVVSGLEHYTSVAASHDGRRIVATVANPTATLWRVPILDRIADDADVERFAVPHQRALAPRFSARSLFYLSGGTAQDGVWRTENGQATEIWRGRDGHVVDPPAIAPDGTRLAVTLRRDRRQQLHVMAADGTDARSIGPDIEARGAAGWSPDQRSVAIGGRDARGPALFTIPLAGGDPVRLVEGEAVNPEWSPDGNLLLYNGPNVDGYWPLLALGADGRRVTLPPIRTRPGGHRFLPDGNGVVYRIMGDFWLLDLATNQTRQLTRLKLETSPLARQAFDVTPDGKSIVFDRSSDNSDVVLIELPR
jgi:Tol biopolymer transport system component